MDGIALFVMNQNLYTKEFPSTIEAVGDTIRGALKVLKDHNWCSSDHDFCIRLCIEEALTNAVIHGNQNNADRCVRLDIYEDGECCHIRVTDEGKGFDPDTIHMPDCEELGGRGVCLIKHFMEGVRFNIDKNALEMIFNRETFTSEVKDEHGLCT